MDQLLQFLKAKLTGYFEDEDPYKNTMIYIQPPADNEMERPCILISREPGDTKFADNSPYRHLKRYLLTGIDDDPESPLYDLLASLPRSTHSRSFPADNLNHDVFTLFF
jgi:hypothetical protein